jgi:hypothetical protein
MTMVKLPSARSAQVVARHVMVAKLIASSVLLVDGMNPLVCAHQNNMKKMMELALLVILYVLHVIKLDAPHVLTQA